ncbi:MAG: indolepyruvate ferredoxin oxidoreductase [Bacteroidetes bacterium GWF2_38_335]|nr:MAG: indolepyruvate ferredoxin oxidoreductase [Bacteroidetes bacterium GWF2_38_335]OFY78282.1 MAG: indolepyruvate ferredoxin oxidoreductase [Bacteroidetes bacterium RIFOXYA12_FULL_38_20]HBS87523.1 indolepyruvate ferredoxin oxidoreductase [Bacteroidales bacterium]
MSKTGNFLLSENAFSETVIGNTAIVRAMIESDVRVVTSYPGSPTPEIASAIASIPLDNRPFYFEFSVNEKVATEVAFGATMNGHTSCVFFKSVGINVAADTFVQLGFYDLKGGMVIVLGDDPGANSSQNEQDNRHLTNLSYIPVYEPATPQETYDMFLDAVKISREKMMPVVFRLTTHVCHAKQKVNFGKWLPQTYDWNSRFHPLSSPAVAITTKALEMKRKAMKRLEEFREISEKSAFNNIISHNNPEKGIITTGVPFLSVSEVLNFALTKKPDILKLGIIYPVPSQKIIEFLKTHREIKIIEELDDVLEKEIKVLAFDHKIDCIIKGKQEPEDFVGEYTPDKVYEIISRTWPGMLPAREASIAASPFSARVPQLCPGCGHRPLFTAVRKLMEKNDITVGDIGCHTLGFLPPHEIGSVVVSMGHSVSTGSGLSINNNQGRVIAFVGDSTFFHAAMPGVLNAVFNNHKLTLVVLPNGTTGMTGHQDHPGSGKNFNGTAEPVPVRKVLEGLGVKNIRECDAYNQQKVIEYIKASFEDDGFSVVIAEHPCMLKKTREDKALGKFTGNQIMVNQDMCSLQLDCIRKFGCPSFQISSEGKIFVHEDLCIGDGSCMQTCNSRALRNNKKTKSN